MSVSRSVRVVALALAAGLAATGLALAQARHPFAIGATESGGPGGAFGLWLITEQARLTHAMTTAIRGTRDSPAAFWTLAGLSFGYGVFHAAGPGHGKAVMASYMIANERALRRGLALTGAAALLQAAVAIVLVAAMRLILGTTAAQMTDAARAVELASYGAIACLGAWLVWRKGRAFVVSLVPLARPAMTFAFPGAMPGQSRFVCEAVDADHVHDAGCGHLHAPDPAKLEGAFAWGPALAAVAAAGARPCSGAIVVLVFALAQDAFTTGVVAALFMALGTALTTGALAATAVYAKRVAMRLVGAQTRRGLVVARAAELCAALFVFVIGVALLLGSTFAQAVA